VAASGPISTALDRRVIRYALDGRDGDAESPICASPPEGACTHTRTGHLSTREAGPEPATTDRYRAPRRRAQAREWAPPRPVNSLQRDVNFVRDASDEALNRVDEFLVHRILFGSLWEAVLH